MMEAREIAILARLLETGIIKAGVKNESLISRLNEARWLMLGTRKSEWVLRPDAVASIKNRLEYLLPTWSTDFDLLRESGLDPFDASDIEALPMLRRNLNSYKLMLNRRNWKAASGLGPKHKAKLESKCVLTRDSVLRFRPNIGLEGVFGDETIDFAKVSKVWTECTVPERAWQHFKGFKGVLPRVAITCENLGAYIDLPAAASTLVIFSPGADTEDAIRLLKSLPDSLWWHFGDLDPEGLDIARFIAKATGRELRLFIPEFAHEYIDSAKSHDNVWKNVPEIPVMLALMKARQRIFQEVFMLDERLAKSLQANNI